MVIRIRADGHLTTYGAAGVCAGRERTQAAPGGQLTNRNGQLTRGNGQLTHTAGELAVPVRELAVPGGELALLTTWVGKRPFVRTLITTHDHRGNRAGYFTAVGAQAASSARTAASWAAVGAAAGSAISA